MTPTRKFINGVYAPNNFDQAFGSWIHHTAGMMCGLCLRGKQRAQLYPELTPAERKTKIAGESYFIPLADVMNWTPSKLKGRWKSARWTAYKRHIKTVHGGNWNLNQGFGAEPPAK